MGKKKLQAVSAINIVDDTKNLACEEQGRFTDEERGLEVEPPKTIRRHPPRTNKGVMAHNRIDTVVEVNSQSISRSSSINDDHVDNQVMA